MGAALLLAGAAVPPQKDAAPAVITAAMPGDSPLAVPNPFGLLDQAIAQGRFDAAREIIGRIAATRGGPELQLRTAELALAQGALPEAATTFADLLNNDLAGPATANDPATRAAAQQGLGLTRLRQGDLPAATAALDAALATDPTLVRAWTALGVIADRKRDFDTANAAYARALAIAPDSVAALNNHGYSLLLQRQPQAAEAPLMRALAVDPALAATCTNLRLARALQGRYKEAFEGATPDRLAAAMNTIGFAAMVRGDYATAETYFNRALAQNSKFDAVAWANLRYLKDTTDPLLPERRTAELAH
jgi:Flp pilus assembly protein TadD